MYVTIKQEVAKIIKIENLKPLGISSEDFKYGDDIVIHLAQHPIEKIKQFQIILNKVPDKRKTQYVSKDIQSWIDLSENKDTKIRKIELFKPALIKYILPIEGKRVFKKYFLDSEIVLPYRVSRILYHPPSQYSPASVEMKMVFTELGEKSETSISFHHRDAFGKTVKEILGNQSIFAETKEMREKYLKQHEKFLQIFDNIGKQYLASGVGTDDTFDDEEDDEDDRRHYGYHAEKQFEFDDNKVVIDVFRETSTKESGREKEIDYGELFWKNPFKPREGRYNEYDDDDDDYSEVQSSETKKVMKELNVKKEGDIEIPTHDFLTIFDLQRHLRLKVHVKYLKEYKYDKTLSEKLVLSEENKQLIQILIEHKEGGFRDIVQNKTGGAIILLTGRAGTGKTLTAEVFAESKEKALYNVQSSQLGVTPKKLEKRLMKILLRTARWNAILLIDEADVYVHARGNDINQNAIVGVFLRILEYHSSVLFMTTNRPDIVDDAIASRCVARIDYKYPTKEQQKKIWRILSDSSEIDLKDQVIKDFVDNNDDYSGRDIKNLLKLSNLRAKALKQEISADDIKYVTKFNPTLPEREKDDDK